MPKLELLIPNVIDPVSRENFDRIKHFYKDDLFNHFDGKFFDIEFIKSVVNFKYPHYLGFRPKDVIQTSLTGSGTLTWDFDNFDKENLVLTTTGACRFRGFIGTYLEE